MVREALGANPLCFRNASPPSLRTCIAGLHNRQLKQLLDILGLFFRLLLLLLLPLFLEGPGPSKSHDAL